MSKEHSRQKILKGKEKKILAKSYNKDWIEKSTMYLENKNHGLLQDVLLATYRIALKTLLPLVLVISHLKIYLDVVTDRNKKYMLTIMLSTIK